MPSRSLSHHLAVPLCGPPVLAVALEPEPGELRAELLGPLGPQELPVLSSSSDPEKLLVPPGRVGAKNRSMVAKGPSWGDAQAAAPSPLFSSTSGSARPRLRTPSLSPSPLFLPSLGRELAHKHPLSEAAAVHPEARHGWGGLAPSSSRAAPPSTAQRASPLDCSCHCSAAGMLGGQALGHSLVWGTGEVHVARRDPTPPACLAGRAWQRSWKKPAGD